MNRPQQPVLPISEDRLATTNLQNDKSHEDNINNAGVIQAEKIKEDNTNTNINAKKNMDTNMNTNTNVNMNSNMNSNMNENMNTNTNVNANANMNENMNTNTNANANANMNANTNVNNNANTNVNTNSNTNANTNANLNTSTNMDINNNNNNNNNNILADNQQHVNSKLLKMDSLLNDAYEMMQMHIVPSSNSKKQNIPLDEFNSAKGIVLARCWKGGLFISESKGSGVLLSRCNDDWSGPCAISIQGLSIGLEVGYETIDYILLLRDDSAFRLFHNKGAIHFGASGEISAGPIDKEADVRLVTTKVSDSIISYSFTKGVYAGLSMNGSIITVKDNVNQEYYGREVTATDIVYDKVKRPANTNYSQLVSLLKQYHTATN